MQYLQEQCMQIKVRLKILTTAIGCRSNQSNISPAGGPSSSLRIDTAVYDGKGRAYSRTGKKQEITLSVSKNVVNF